MTKLETRIAARNEVNAIAIEYTAKCRLALAPLIGQQIILASGQNSAKFRKICDAFALPVACYISTGRGYSVTANFKVCKTTDAGTFYAEATLYLHDIKNGVMMANDNYLTHTNHLRTDFDWQEITAAREIVRMARIVLQNAENALCGFGEHDNN